MQLILHFKVAHIAIQAAKAALQPDSGLVMSLQGGFNSGVNFVALMQFNVTAK